MAGILFSDVYRGLRETVLSVKGDGPVDALLMDMPFPGAAATLVGVPDGSTSLYFSSGGGVIGGGAHKTVADATRSWLELGALLLPALKSARRVELPDGVHVQFVAVTPAGPRAASAVEEELGSGKHPLSPSLPDTR